MTGRRVDPLQLSDAVARLRSAGIEASREVGRRAQYSSDASLYRVVPAVVAYPRSRDDLAALVQVCREHEVPLTMRGAGTSVAGNAIGTGVVADTSRYLNRIVSVDIDNKSAIVEPGVILDELQRAVAPHGLRFGPDPSTHNRATFGGMIGNNACGSRALGYGRTVDNVLGLSIITGSGVIGQVWSPAALKKLGIASDSLPEPSTHALRQLTSSLNSLVSAQENLIRAECGRFTRQLSGYPVEYLLPSALCDVARFLVGTEGSCAVVCEATIGLISAPRATVLVVLGYPTMPEAADAVPALLAHHPVAVEGLDARIVTAVRQRFGAASVPDLPAGQGWLLVELGGDNAGELQRQARELVGDSAALASDIITDSDRAATLWRIREDGAGLASRSSRGKPAFAGWEDAAVPPQQLGAYLRAFDELLTEYDLTAMPFGHFGDGCVHVRLDFPLGDKQSPQRYREFVMRAADLVAAHRGSMSGEHGDGRARGELLAKMYSPELISLFAQIKGLFDPAGILNPGVIVDAPNVVDDMRIPAVRERRLSTRRHYLEDGDSFVTAAHRCVGIGKCRVEKPAPMQVMCPSYQATRDEQDSTRGRARVLQEMINGTVIDGGWRSPQVRQALELCLSCKGCSSDCPAGVDMAAFKSEVLYQAYRHRIRPRSHYSLGWLPLWASWASRAPWLANATLRFPGVAAVVKALGGIDQRRSLPAFARRSFYSQWRRQAGEQLHRNRADIADLPPVVLWIDTFTNYFSPAVAMTAVDVLSRCGFRVTIVPKRQCCGLTWITTGQLDHAAKLLAAGVDALQPHVADGAVVVGLEPSCTAVLAKEAPELLGATTPAGSDVAAVSGAVHTVAQLLTQYQPTGQWDLSGKNIVAQPHCHHHAAFGWQQDQLLLQRAGANLTRAAGCCGLAGNFGVERGHYETSVAVASNALLPALQEHSSDIVLADGFSCRTQIDDLAGRRAHHLVELLVDNWRVS